MQAKGALTAGGPTRVTTAALARTRLWVEVTNRAKYQAPAPTVRQTHISPIRGKAIAMAALVECTVTAEHHRAFGSRLQLRLPTRQWPTCSRLACANPLFSAKTRQLGNAAPQRPQAAQSAGTPREPIAPVPHTASSAPTMARRNIMRAPNSTALTNPTPFPSSSSRNLVSQAKRSVSSRSSS